MTNKARIYNGVKTTSLTNGVGKPRELYAKNQTGLLSHTKKEKKKKRKKQINSKYIKDLKT